MKDLDVVAIIARAEQLRPGHKCTVKVPENATEIDYLLTGSYNIHLTLRYDDDVTWLIRFPGLPYGPQPAEIVAAVLESEVVTYEVLRTMGLPVAAVHDWGVGDLSLSKSKFLGPCSGPSRLPCVGTDLTLDRSQSVVSHI